MKENIEIERKYIIKMPSVTDMAAMSDYSCSDIVQIYLSSPERITHRIRSRRYNGGETVYTETKKIRIDKLSSVEDEAVISEERFAQLSASISCGTRPVIKKRHTFLYCGQLFEIDVYPDWQKSAIMETELSEREKAVKMPDFIKIVREVTGIKEYSNASMSKSFPKEDELC